MMIRKKSMKSWWKQNPSAAAASLQSLNAQNQASGHIKAIADLSETSLCCRTLARKNSRIRALTTNKKCWNLNRSQANRARRWCCMTLRRKRWRESRCFNTWRIKLMNQDRNRIWWWGNKRSWPNGKRWKRSRNNWNKSWRRSRRKFRNRSF